MNTKTKTSIIAGFMLAATGPLMARDVPAFELIKAGDPFVGVQSKDKVVQIRSEKSIATMTPDVWHVDYYDPNSGPKCVEVTFSAGQETEISHPRHPFQKFHEMDILDQTKLKVDSDAALRTAIAHPLLKHLTLKASQITLDRSDIGPVWMVRIWAAKLNNPDKQVDIGVLTLSAADGSIVKNELRPDRVDSHFL